MIINAIEYDREEFITNQIINDLPSWIGLTKKTKGLILECCDQPLFTIYLDQQLIGLASLKPISRYSIEIFGLLIHRKYYQQGNGKELYQTIENDIRSKGYKCIIVKNLENPLIDKENVTNYFFKSVGFNELHDDHHDVDHHNNYLWNEPLSPQSYIKYLN